jgi:hypothetical protein
MAYVLENDPNINIDILKRKEFYQYKIDPAAKKPRRSDYATSKSNKGEINIIPRFLLDKMISEGNHLQLQSYQTFVANYINPNTPYSRLLIKWSTGSGKSIAGLSICMSFIQYYQKEEALGSLTTGSVFIIGFSEAVFKKELLSHPEFGFITQAELNRLKAIKKLAYSGSAFDVAKLQEFLTKLKKRFSNRQKGGFFKFIGYKKLVNMIFILQDDSVNLNELDEDGIDDAIKRGKIKLNKDLLNQFQNSIIVCDEIHNVYNSLDKNNWGVALQYILNSHPSVRAVFMSATPINNNPTEIVDLLNLLLPKTYYKKLDKTEFFDANKQLKRGALDKIASLCKGRISYVRDINPKYFPKRTFVGEDLPGAPYLKFIRCPMSQFHYNTYKAVYSGSLGHDSQYLSDFALPNPKNPKIGIYRTSEVKKELPYASQKWKDVNKINYRKDLIVGDILRRHNIGIVSSKFAKMLDDVKENITKKNGKMFIYHNIIHMSGVLFIQEALLQNNIISETGSSTDSTLCVICGKMRKDHSVSSLKIGGNQPQTIKSKKHSYLKTGDNHILTTKDNSMVFSYDKYDNAYIITEVGMCSWGVIMDAVNALKSNKSGIILQSQIKGDTYRRYKKKLVNKPVIYRNNDMIYHLLTTQTMSKSDGDQFIEGYIDQVKLALISTNNSHQKNQSTADDGSIDPDTIPDSVDEDDSNDADDELTEIEGGEYTMDHSVMDHGVMDHSVMDHGVMDHGVMDHGVMDHSVMDHSVMDHGVVGGDEVKESGHMFQPVRFVVVHSNLDRSTINMSLEKYNSPDNSEGHRFLILIGGKLIKESHDIKAVREIMVMGRPDNIPTLIQIIGRGVRKGSHSYLPKEKHTVNVRIYTSALPIKNSKTKKYELSYEEEKYVEKLNHYITIQHIEKTLHENAVDAVMNKDIVWTAAERHENKTKKNTNELGPLYFEPNIPAKLVNKTFTINELNLDTFNAFHAQNEINSTIVIIKRLFIETSTVWKYHDLLRAVRRPPFTTEFNTTYILDRSFNIALTRLVWIKDSQYVEPIITRVVDQVSSVIDTLYNYDDKIIIMPGEQKSVITQIGDFYILFPIDEMGFEPIKSIETPYRIMSKKVPVLVDIRAVLESGASLTNYSDKKDRFFTKWNNVSIEHLEMAVCDFGTEFHEHFLEDCIEYAFRVWTDNSIKKSPIHSFYFKMLNYYDLRKLVIWGNTLKLYMFKKYKNYLQPVTTKIKTNARQKLEDIKTAEADVSTSGLINMLKSSINKSDLHWVSSGMKKQFEDQVSNSLHLFDGNYKKKTAFKKVNSDIVPTGHFLSKVPRFYHPANGWFENPEYLDATQEFVENNILVGYDERSKTGIHIRFKIRNTIQNIKQFKDSRLIEKGSVCSSKSKVYLKAIALKLGIKMRDKINVNVLCNDIRTKLIYLELKERIAKSKKKYFYFIYERRPEVLVETKL